MSEVRVPRDLRVLETSRFKSTKVFVKSVVRLKIRDLSEYVSLTFRSFLQLKILDQFRSDSDSRSMVDKPTEI